MIFRTSLRSRLLPGVLISLAFTSAQAQITVTDDLGATVSLPAPAARIVALAPSITESLFAIGAGSRVVGVTSHCTYPPEARSVAQVGGMINPTLEVIVALRPDLVIMSVEGNDREDYARLRRLGLSVFVSNPRSLEGIYRSVRQLGALTGRDTAAVSLVESLRARERAVREKAAGRAVPVLMVISLQPLMVVGTGTFLAELLEAAGGLNLAAGASGTYPAYSREAVAVQDPHVLVLTSDLVADDETLTAMFPEWRRLTAIRERRVARVDADLVSRPGPRALSGLELLSQVLTPSTP